MVALPRPSSVPLRRIFKGLPRCLNMIDIMQSILEEMEAEPTFARDVLLQADEP